MPTNPPEADVAGLDRVRALVSAVEAGRFDEIEAVADKWAASTGVQRMANAMASVFEKHAPQDIMDRFREKLAALMHLAFVEGAAQGVLQIAPAADLIDRLTAEREAAETEIMWEVWQDDMLVASSTDEMDGRHYAAVYAQDGPARFVRAETRRTPA